MSQREKILSVPQQPGPGHAVEFIEQIFIGQLLAFSDIFRGDADHLFPTQPLLQPPLMISAAGIGTVLIDLDDTVQHKSAVISAVEGQVVFLQFSRNGRQSNPVAVADDKWIHACPGDRQGKGAAIVQGLFDKRIIVSQLYFIQGNQLLPVWR